MFKPNVQHKRVWSDTLQTMVPFNLTASALRMIDKWGGEENGALVTLRGMGLDYRRVLRSWMPHFSPSFDRTMALHCTRVAKLVAWCLQCRPGQLLAEHDRREAGLRVGDRGEHCLPRDKRASFSSHTSIFV